MAGSGTWQETLDRVGELFPTPQLGIGEVGISDGAGTAADTENSESPPAGKPSKRPAPPDYCNSASAAAKSRRTPAARWVSTVPGVMIGAGSDG